MTVHQSDSTESATAADRITGVVTRYETAFNQNDARAMNALFTEDAIFVNFGGNLVFGAERLYEAQAFVFAADGPLARVEVRYSVESVVFLSPDIAMAHARQRSIGADGQLTLAEGDHLQAVLALTLVRNADGDWRVRAAQNTPVPVTAG